MQDLAIFRNRNIFLKEGTHNKNQNLNNEEWLHGGGITIDKTGQPQCPMPIIPTFWKAEAGRLCLSKKELLKNFLNK